MEQIHGWRVADARPPRRPASAGASGVTAHRRRRPSRTARLPGWPWPVDAAQFDRRRELLSRDEREALELSAGTCVAGPALAGPRRSRVAQRSERLVRPLDAAPERALHGTPMTALHRRVGQRRRRRCILQRLRRPRAGFWAWAAAGLGDGLIGTSASEFRTAVAAVGRARRRGPYRHRSTPTCSAGSPPSHRLGNFNRAAAGLARLRRRRRSTRRSSQVSDGAGTAGATRSTRR